MALPSMVSALAGAVANIFSSQRDKLTPENSSAIAELTASSIYELGKDARVEPITVIDRTLTNYDSTTDVLKFINSLYASWYLHAASVVTDVGRIRTAKLLQKLNPEKSPGYALANSILSGGVGNEDLSPFNEVNASLKLPKSMNFSFEAAAQPTANGPVASSNAGANSAQNNGSTPTGAGNGGRGNGGGQSAQGGGANNGGERNNQRRSVGFRPGNDLVTVQNLSIGQTIMVPMSDGSAQKDLAVTVRLIAIPVTTSLLKTILSWSQRDNRLSSRISAWRAGELSFWRDLILMRDIFIERRRILMNDNSDLLVTMLGRQRNSMLHSIMTMQPSVGTISSIMVIAEDSLREIEHALDGRIKDFKFRQRVMNATGIMVLAVVDPMTQFVTVYTYTQVLPGEYSISQLKSATGRNDLDMGQLVTLMGKGQMPNL